MEWIKNEDLAFLPVNTQEGQAYIKDMNFALDYAKEKSNIDFVQKSVFFCTSSHHPTNACV